MQVSLLLQNYNQNKQANFRAGMTPKIMSQINAVDVKVISKSLSEKGIDTDFNDNKVIAWCSNKVIEIFEQLNKKYGKNLPMPNGIYADDFTKLVVKDTKNMKGYCNMFPTYLYKNSNDIVDGETVLFNTSDSEIKELTEDQRQMYDWLNIDNWSDIAYEKNIFPTPHFLYIFLHEFSHVAHEDNMLDKMSVNKLLRRVQDALSPQKIEKYRAKYGKEISSTICSYATDSPFEAIACDIPRRITDVLDEDLEITKNPFENSPYERQNFLNSLKTMQANLDKPLSKFWKGKFD